MSNELKILLNNHKIDQLYKNNLFSIKSICELLGIWDKYSSDEKYKLENITKRDSRINKNFTYDGVYDLNLIYGEVLRSGVDIINDKINKYKKPSEKDVFIDIGSGCGKLIIHMAIISNIKTLVGLELLSQRSIYSKYIKDQILPESNNIFFINKDVKDFDLSFATIVFMNNLSWDEENIMGIYKSLSKGCHFITARPIDDCKILKEEFLVDVSWGSKLNLYYYIK